MAQGFSSPPIKASNPVLKTQIIGVNTSGATSAATPVTGKKMRVYAIAYSFQTTAAFAVVTNEAKIRFETSTVWLASFRTLAAGAGQQSGIITLPYPIVGAVDEPVTLTGWTFSAGATEEVAIIYYDEV